MPTPRIAYWNKHIWLICAVCLSWIAHSVYAQDTTLVTSRPKVGLVLSGGGAKGAAHIGVLKYIEEMGIPIDYIAGNSMGTVMGGLYAQVASTSQAYWTIQGGQNGVELALHF